MLHTIKFSTMASADSRRKQKSVIQPNSSSSVFFQPLYWAPAESFLLMLIC